MSKFQNYLETIKIKLFKYYINIKKSKLQIKNLQIVY